MLNKECEEKLQAWLAPSTWHTSHPNDMDRWYDFVDVYQRNHGNVIDEAALKEHIAHSVVGGVNDALIEIISQRISLAYNIIDFLNRTKR